MLFVALGRPLCLPVELGYTTVPAQVAAEQTPVAATAAAAPAQPLPVVLRTAELGHYRLRFGMLGEVGALTIELAPSDGTGVRVWATGHGSFLGIGAIEKNLASEVDLRSSGTRRFTSTRRQNGVLITDIVDQPQPGAVALIRKRSDKADEASTFQRGRAVEDPVGFLLRLRTMSDAGPRVFEVLDGRALWTITVGNPVLGKLDDNNSAKVAWRFEGRAEPIYWNGTSDPERSVRTFELWVDNDVYRTPLRLRMPMGLGEVVAELVSVKRTPAGPAVAVAR